MSAKFLRDQPTAVVWRGNGETSECQYQMQDLSQVSFTNLKGEEETFKHHLDRTFTDALLSIKDGKIITVLLKLTC